MVDRDKIENKIRYVKDNLEKLKELQQESKQDFLNDYLKYDTAKYNLQVSIEALIDIGNHIISRENFKFPDTNADTFKILKEENIISKNKLKAFIAMAKFRNMVVHLYDKIDEKEIYDILQNHLDDFEYFIQRIVEIYLTDEETDEENKKKEKQEVENNCNKENNVNDK